MADQPTPRLGRVMYAALEEADALRIIAGTFRRGTLTRYVSRCTRQRSGAAVVQRCIASGYLRIVQFGPRGRRTDDVLALTTLGRDALEARRA